MSIPCTTYHYYIHILPVLLEQLDLYTSIRILHCKEATGETFLATFSLLFHQRKHILLALMLHKRVAPWRNIRNLQGTSAGMSSTAIQQRHPYRKSVRPYYKAFSLPVPIPHNFLSTKVGVHQLITWNWTFYITNLL